MTETDKVALLNAQEEVNGILQHNDNNRSVRTFRGRLHSASYHVQDLANGARSAGSEDLQERGRAAAQGRQLRHRALRAKHAASCGHCMDRAHESAPQL